MIDSIIHFTPVIPTLGILVIWTLMFLLFLYLEWNRKLPYTTSRIAMLILAMLSLLFIILEPHYTSIKNESYIVITNSYDRKVLDSIISRNPSHQIVSIGESNRFKNKKVIEKRSDLIKIDGKISYIIGEGLDENYLSLLKHHNFTFIQTGQPLGITQIELPSRASEGADFHIKGFVRNSKSASIQLIGPAGIIDSVRTQKEGIQPFLIRGKMKQNQSGQFTIRIIDQGNVSDNRIPLLIDEFKKIEILLLQSNPSFEIKQLKNLLAEQGHSLQVRTQISKNNFTYENLNNQFKHFEVISQSTLAGKDLLLIESNTLEDLEENEIESIFEAVKNGLGVIVLINTAINKSLFKHKHWHYNFTEASSDTVHLLIPGLKKRHILKRNPLQLKPDQTTMPVLSLGKENLSAYQISGKGKVAVQLLQETYRLRLEGDSMAYSFIWNTLISKTSRKRIVTDRIDIVSDFPNLENHCLKFRLWTTADIPYVTYQSHTIPMIEDIHVDGLWYGKIWPQKTGWQSIMLQDGKSFNFFVSDDHEWTTLRSRQNSDHTKAISKAGIQSGQQLQEEEKAVPLLFFYLLFLLSIGFLWLVPKI